MMDCARPCGLFDAYGTLFDVHSVGLAGRTAVPGRGDALALLWRDKQIDYTRLVLDERALPAVLGPDPRRPALCRARLGLPLDRAAEERLMNQYRHLSRPSPRTARCCRPAQRGVPHGILSNGDPEMLAVAVKSAGFEDLLQHPCSACTRCSASRPTPPPMRWARRRWACRARDPVRQSSNGWDAIGATWFGYTTLWVNRSRRAAGAAGHHPQPHRPQPARRARHPSFPPPDLFFALPFPDPRPATMTPAPAIHRLQVADDLLQFHRPTRAARHRHRPGRVLAGFDAIVHDLAPRNAAAAGRA
jgi:2-haloacid dehalogenase